MTDQIAQSNDSELQELAAKAMQAQQQHCGSGGSAQVNIDEQYNARFLLTISMRLSLTEVAALLRATNARERGLVLARGGDFVSSSTVLHEAWAIIDSSALCREATLSADSFQSPAEAYLLFRQGRFSEAESCLYNALKCCQALRVEYCHENEVRRIHLARNIVRVRTFSGDLSGALAMAGALLEYVEGNQESWPIPELGVSVPDHLSVDERWILLDQILGEIALLITRRNPRSRELIESCHDLLCSPTLSIEAGCVRAHTWLMAQRASVENDMPTFLCHAIDFFSEGPCYLHRAWKELTAELFEVCLTIAPNLVAEQGGKKVSGTFD
jgi:hypothetical protein